MTFEKKQITSSAYILPPGNMGLPFFGEAASLMSDPQDFSNRKHHQYGSIFKTRVLGQPIIYVSGVDACRFVLENENVYFENKMLPNIEALLGSSSLTIQTGQTHQDRRKLLRKVFSPVYLIEQVTIIREITEAYFTRWAKLKEFTWYPELRKYTFDIACKLLIGLDRASETKLCDLYETWSQGLFSFSFPLPWTKLGRALKSRQQILLYIEEIVNNRQHNSTSGKDALSLLLQARDENENSLSIDEIKDQILNLLSAGHGTLASSLASFCLLLAQHPNILEFCRVEQNKLNTLDTISIESLEQMSYLESVLKEVLRVIPPVGGGFRKVIKNCNFNDFLFPKGWRVIYEINLTHESPKLFVSPDVFDPSRFDLDVNNKAYFPFGGGKRRCLGENLAKLEMKMFAAMLINNCEWSLTKEQNLQIQQFPFPHPSDNLKVCFHRL